MKNFSSFVNLLCAALLALVLLSLGLPAAPARAAQPALLTPQPTPAPALACDSSRSVQVSGTAVINVTPDRALIQLGVQSNGRTVAAVEQANSEAMARLLRAVKAQGIEAKDIATDWYVIEPLYADYDSLSIKGYRINNVVAITVRQVGQTSRVIAAALQAGANQVINVDLYTSELRKYRDQARELAMQAAKEKAEALASAAGAEAGCVLSISENSWSAYHGWWAGRSQTANQWTQNVLQNAAPTGSAASGTGDEPLSLGQISVTAEINASFGLK